MRSTIIKGILGATLALILGLGLLVWWAQGRVDELRDQPRPDIAKEVPVPYPPRSGEIVDADAALAAAAERGRHLVISRLGCDTCHGADMAGDLYVDAWPALVLHAPNITMGARVADWSTKDWDRLVRFGVKPDGEAALMPVIESTRISDQELSDVIAYIRSLPPSDAPSRPPEIGPVGAIALALGKLHFSADEIDRTTPRPERPPASDDTLAMGEHIAHVCKGCHRADFSGGLVPGGDPSWPPAADLRPGGTLDSYTEEQFVTLMRTGKRPDGSDVDPAMPWATTANMTRAELGALWAWLQTVPGGE